MSNHDLDTARGRIKEAAGSLSGNEDLKNEGRADQAAGSVKSHVDDAADKLKHLVDKARD